MIAMVVPEYLSSSARKNVLCPMSSASRPMVQNSSRGLSVVHSSTSRKYRQGQDGLRYLVYSDAAYTRWGWIRCVSISEIHIVTVTLVH